MVTAIATGNTAAFTNAAASVIGTSAAGDLGKIMVGIPKTLVSDLAKNLAGSFGASAAVPGNVQSWIQQGMAIAGVSGADWESGLEIIAMHESGGSQSAVNTSDINAQEGHPSAGLLQFVLPTFLQYAKPGYAQWMNPVDQVVADAWHGGYISSVYGSIDNVPGVKAVRAGKPYVGYDSGGALPPGMTMAVNATGKPEAVLTSQQWQTLAALADHLTGRGPAGTAGAGAAQRPIELNFYGQYPTGEAKATMMRELALALGGAS